MSLSRMNSLHAAGTDGYDVGVDHQIAQAAIAFQGMVVIIGEERLFFRFRQPEVAGDPAITLVDFATSP